MDVGVDQLEMLQKLGKYRAVTTKLKRSALMGIAFGMMAVAAVVSGEEAFPQELFGAVLLAIGVAICLVSLWQLTSPSLSGLLAEGVVIIVLGVWNIAVSVLLAGRSMAGEGSWAGVGVVQIGTGIHSIAQYSKLRKDFPEEPSKESIRLVDELVSNLLAMTRKTSEALVEFKSKPFLGQAKNWKGVLLGDAAIFVTKQRDVTGARKAFVTVKRGRKLALQKTHKAELHVGTEKHKGLMPAWSLERFEAWKAAEEGGVAPEGALEQDATRERVAEAAAEDAARHQRPSRLDGI
ncbi:MAG TPA: hypothetical protein VFH61_10965 [Thermoleophilia bacterium]|nr:hypothetical protein [Thermoleophilia bacterium]